jgi:hypothetical protein
MDIVANSSCGEGRKSLLHLRAFLPDLVVVLTGLQGRSGPIGRDLGQIVELCGSCT